MINRMVALIVGFIVWVSELAVLLFLVYLMLTSVRAVLTGQVGTSAIDLGFVSFASESEFYMFAFVAILGALLGLYKFGRGYAPAEDEVPSGES